MSESYQYESHQCKFNVIAVPDWNSHCVVRSLKIPRGRGVLEAKLLEEKYEAKLEFPWGGGGGAKQKTFHEGSMDIF